MDIEQYSEKNLLHKTVGLALLVFVNCSGLLNIEHYWENNLLYKTVGLALPFFVHCSGLLDIEHYWESRTIHRKQLVTQNNRSCSACFCKLLWPFGHWARLRKQLVTQNSRSWSACFCKLLWPFGHWALLGKSNHPPKTTCYIKMSVLLGLFL